MSGHPPLSRSVVHIAPQLRLGAGRYIVDTVLEQNRTGWQVFVAVGDDSENEWRSDQRLIAELENEGVCVLRPGDLFRRSVPGLLQSARALRAGLPEGALAGVAHAHTAMTAAVARWAGVRTVVATCHGWNVARDQAYNVQDALAFQLVDAVTSPSTYWADILRQELGMPEVAVVPVGLDLRRFPPASTTTRTPAHRIVTVAELTARKGIADLLDAMPGVWAESPTVELHILGDGEEQPALVAKSAELDPRGARIVFHGFVPQPYRHIQSYDLFCLPSRSDNFPVALMEAMLARLPVVATDAGGIPELVGGSGCGFVVPAKAPTALSAAILRTIDLGADARNTLGELGERFIRARCSIDVTVGQLTDLYSQAAARHRAPRAPGLLPCD
jgi:glycosyltransferase involved in cell wall biosynthesis